MAKLTPINLPRERGMCYVMTFVYTPKGTVLLTGDYSSVNNYCKDNFGMCHAMVYWYSNRSLFPTKRWSLLGNDWDSGLQLTHVDFDRLSKEGQYWRSKGVKRPMWVLYQRGGTVLHTWRRLPSTYINFKKLMQTV